MNIEGDPWTISSVLSRTGLAPREIRSFHRINGRNEVWILNGRDEIHVIKVFTVSGQFAVRIELLVDEWLPYRDGPHIVDSDPEVPFVLWRTPSRRTLWREVYGTSTPAQLADRAKQIANSLFEVHALVPIPDLLGLEANHVQRWVRHEEELPTSPAQLMLSLLVSRLGIVLDGVRTASSSVIHGDVRLSNIVVVDDDSWLIDFETLKLGNPEMDLAQIIIEIAAAAVRTNRNPYTDTKSFGSELLHRYTSLTGVNPDSQLLSAHASEFLVSGALEYERGRERVALESIQMIEMAHRLNQDNQPFEEYAWTQP